VREGKLHNSRMGAVRLGLCGKCCCNQDHSVVVCTVCVLRPGRELQHQFNGGWGLRAPNFEQL